MSKLDRFMIQSEINIEATIAELEAELDGDNGHIQPGDVCQHVDWTDFRCEVVSVDDGTCKVHVLSGWRGRPPQGAVPAPRRKLRRVGQ